MEILRKYKKLSTWDFLALIDSEIECETPPSYEDYCAYLDELKLRTFESISEGELYKIRLRAKRLIERAQGHLASEQIEQLHNLAQEI